MRAYEQYGSFMQDSTAFGFPPRRVQLVGYDQRRERYGEERKFNLYHSGTEHRPETYPANANMYLYPA